MNPYNEATPCPKCGAADAQTEYQDLSNACGIPVLAKMRRTCRRCAYNWYELPLDAPALGAYFESKQKHIESADSNAICLCGAELVYRGSGLFVCPNEENKKGNEMLDTPGPILMNCLKCGGMNFSNAVCLTCFPDALRIGKEGPA